MKLRKVVDTLVVDEVDAVLAQDGGVELVERLYRRQRDEIPAQLVALSATMDTRTRRQVNRWVRDESNVLRVCSSAMEHALPENLSYFLYCDPTRRGAALLANVLLYSQYVKEGGFRPLVCVPTSEHKAELRQTMQEIVRPKLQSTSCVPKDDSCGFLQTSPIEISSKILVSDFEETRGLNYEGISDVIIYGGVPSPAQFVHLAGCAARNGGKGEVSLIFSPYDSRSVQRLCSVYDIPYKLSVCR